MGVIIGSLMDGSVLCTEAPDSPIITIGQAGIEPIVSTAGDAPLGVYGYISRARQMTVKRKFTLRKKDINAVSLWLTTLSGGGITYIAGSDGAKTISGTFRLDGEIDFTPISPSLCEAQATFIGTILDCNFLLPAGIEFRVLDSRTSAIYVNDKEATRFVSSSDGDGSGISIRAGACIYWADIPSPYRNGLAMIYGKPLDPDAGADIRYNIQEIPYREIFLCNNGEIVRTWYIPCNISHRVKYLYRSPICYGVTLEEWQASGMPTISEILDFSDNQNDRLTGIPQGPYNAQTPSAKPLGNIYQWEGYNEIISNGSTSSWKRYHLLRWDEDTHGPNPNKYRFLVEVGYAWSSVQYGIWWAPFFSTDETTVHIGWSKDGTENKLTATGSDGVVNILLRYE